VPPPASARARRPRRAATDLRPARRGDWLPGLAGWLVALAGLVNIASALLPELPARLRVMTAAAPPEVVVGAHALALPAGLGLLLAAAFLRGRRQRAQRLAVTLLVALGALNVLKGLDVEEAALSWSLAGLLFWGRDAFRVQHDVAALPRVLGRVAGLATLCFALAVAAVSASSHWAAPRPTPGTTLREAAGLLTLMGGPLHYDDAARWLPEAVGLLGLATAVLCASLVLRPLRVSRTPCGRPEAADAIVRAHGTDTLSYFKLREDLPRRFSPDGRALIAYRVESGVMLLSGDPVGPVDALPALVADVCAFADDHGLKVGVLGASEAFADTCRAAGLRSVYIGDEAIVDTGAFSLEGRPIRKVRQAVTRLRKAGYTVVGRRVGELTPAELAALDAISERWRDGAPERGFSMAMDSLANPALAETWVLTAHDATGAPRGFVHFVPSYGRPAMSLSFMRRDRDTPNGLTEFLVVEAILAARELGVEELSLNFAAFGRYLREPEGRGQRLLGELARRGDGLFQIESLHSFNAKFFPRWQPRFLLYDGFAALPRTALAAAWSEGQLPRPRLPRRSDRRPVDRTPAAV
jgi:lysyl-tRNA synthetase, class II